jgi:UDP-N-acetylmuramoyl-L-alanyl-D-glutamate--2,6-diaminopimelate ligase
VTRPIEEFKRTLESVAAVANAQLTGDSATVVTGITLSSNSVQEGDLFVALPGEKTHGAEYAKDAIARGAIGVLTDEVGAAKVSGVPVIVSSNPRRAAGVISAWFYSEPMRDLYSVGVTGTNGKTTVTTLLHQIMSLAGRESGLIGTVETRIGDEVIASKRTTPESSDLQALSAIMRERHMRNLVMEVSSHAIALERIRGSHFAVVAFTNLSQDHLDFHKTMEAYFETKAKLFSFEFADLAVINIDDAYGIKLKEMTELPVMTVSRHDQSAKWHYASITKDYVGAHVAIRGSGGILIEGKVHLHGGYNFDNLLMAVAIATESGIDPIDIAAI